MLDLFIFFIKHIEKIPSKYRLCWAMTRDTTEKIYETLPYFQTELENCDKQKNKSSNGIKTELSS